MVKMRLLGEPKEVAELVRQLEQTGKVDILQESRGYPDRYSSIYRRYYLEVEVLNERHSIQAKV